MIYSYCRVSTQFQSLDRQEEAVKKYCEENNIKIDREFSDKISGKTFERKEYQEMKSLVQADDILIIKELDRFGRSMELIKEEWQFFMKKGVKIIVIDMPLISSDLSGKKTLDMQFIANLVFEVLCYSAEKEREKLSQRTKEALAVKKMQGVKLGRPQKNDDLDLLVEDYTLTNEKGSYIYSIDELSKKYNITAPTIITKMKTLGITRRNKKEVLN